MTQRPPPFTRLARRRIPTTGSAPKLRGLIYPNLVAIRHPSRRRPPPAASTAAATAPIWHSGCRPLTGVSNRPRAGRISREAPSGVSKRRGTEWRVHQDWILFCRRAKRVGRHSFRELTHTSGLGRSNMVSRGRLADRPETVRQFSVVRQHPGHPGKPRSVLGLPGDAEAVLGDEVGGLTARRNDCRSTHRHRVVQLGRDEIVQQWGGCAPAPAAHTGKK